MSEPAPLFGPLKPAATDPRLWTASGFVEDAWRTIGDDVEFPLAGYALISLARWRAEQATLATLGVPVGVVVQPSETLDFVADDIARLAVIALTFPKFTDGRAYSTARRLREVGYAGEIRATGDVLLDQIPLMLRAGFTSFEITSAATIGVLETSSLPALSHVYQSGAETAAREWRSRRAARMIGRAS